jgi:hypothetical protein
LLVSRNNSATLGVMAGDNLAYLHSLSLSRLACSWSRSPTWSTLDKKINEVNTYLNLASEFLYC